MKRFLPFLILFSASAVASAQVLPINQFGGINTDDSPLTLQNGQTPDSRNLVTDDGPGAQGRKGFIRFSTEPSSGLFEFPLSNGTRYLITRTGSNLKATTDGTFSILVGTVPTDRIVAGAVLGDKFFYSDTLNGLKYWNGTSVTTVDKTLAFDKLVTFKGRLVGAGPGTGRLLYLSKYLDGTTFTLAVNPSDDDPSQITVSGSLDETIQALYSTFQDKLIYFKKNSFGGLSGSRRSNFALRVYSDSIGVSSVETIRDCDGKLRWLGNNRKVYQFDGATFGTISEDIDNIFANVSQGDANSRSTSLDTQTDFTPGTSSPTDFMSSSATVGSVVLATMAASNLIDTNQSDFDSGTYSGTNQESAGGVYLSSYSAAVSSFSHPTDGYERSTDLYNGSNCTGHVWLLFSSTYSFTLQTVTFSLAARNSPGDATCYLTDSSRSRLTTIGTFPQSSMGSLPSSFASQQLTLSSPYAIVKNTNYYFELSHPNYKRNSGSGACVSGTQVDIFSGVQSAISNAREYWDVSGTDKRYITSGTFLSRSLDVGFSTNSWLWSWDTFASNGDIPSGTTLTYETQTSSATNGSWTTLASISTGAVTSSTVQEFIRYKATFATSDLNQTPRIDDVTVNLTAKRRPSGVYTSPPVDFGTGVTSLGPFVSAGVTTGGSIAFKYQTSTNSSTSLFLSTGWIPISSGLVSTDTVRRYAAVQSSFTATSATAPLSVDVLTFNWTEGSTIRAASSYINSRYWLGLAISSTSNNGVLVFDKQNQWQRYDGYVPEVMSLYNSRLYVGNSNGIFLSESGYSDNGTPITAYYTTKTFAPAGFDFYGQYDHLYLTTDNSDDVLTPTFQINNNATDNSFGTAAMNGTLGIQNLKYPFSVADVQQGKFINLKWSVTGSSFWRILNGDLYFTPSTSPD